MIQHSVAQHSEDSTPAATAHQAQMEGLAERVVRARADADALGRASGQAQREEEDGARAGRHHTREMREETRRAGCAALDARNAYLRAERVHWWAEDPTARVLLRTEDAAVAVVVVDPGPEMSQVITEAGDLHRVLTANLSAPDAARVAGPGEG